MKTVIPRCRKRYLCTGSPYFWTQKSCRNKSDSFLSDSIFISGSVFRIRLLQQMLTNLLDNAAQHTPQGTTVRIALESTQNGISLAVTDNGPGVSENEAPELFNRFARVDRSRSTPGHGLGLAMVAAIVAAHSGKATIAPRPGFGVHIEL